MSKSTGLGDALYLDGIDVSGDANSVATGGGPALLDQTSIDQSAHERAGGIRTGGIDWVAFFNTAAGRLHDQVKALPRTNRNVLYCRGTALGASAAGCIAKQIGYDGNRANDGGLLFQLSAQSNAYGLEWGKLLTAGKRADTAATDGAAVDLGTGPLSFGGQLYLHLFELTGTDVTIKVQHSANGTTGWADVAGLTVTPASTAVDPIAYRVATTTTTTQILRYVRAVTTTSAGVTSCIFAAMLVRNPVAVSF